jgi:hypothetical protein
MRFLILTIKITLAVASCALAAEAATKTCSKKELALKNCTIILKPYKISFWKEKFSISNGIGRSLVDLPLIQEKTEWDTIRFSTLGSARFVEFVAWQEPNATDIQTKMWYVYEVHDEQATLKLEKSLYKRLLVQDAKAKNDRPKKFGLKLVKKEVHWFIDREKGVLK